MPLFSRRRSDTNRGYSQIIKNSVTRAITKHKIPQPQCRVMQSTIPARVKTVNIIMCLVFGLRTEVRLTRRSSFSVFQHLPLPSLSQGGKTGQGKPHRWNGVTSRWAYAVTPITAVLEYFAVELLQSRSRHPQGQPGTRAQLSDNHGAILREVE